MNWWSRLFGRKRMEEQLEKELRFHLDEHVGNLIARGCTPAEAARQARLALGGLEQVKEKCRDARGTRWLDHLVQDLRYGWRSLMANPTFTAVAVVSLALGVGANTSLFSVVNALLLRPLPAPKPDQLVRIRTGSSHTSHPNLTDLRAQNDALSDLAGHRAGEYSWSRGGTAVRLSGETVTPNYFQVLGVQPVRGSIPANVPGVVIVSYNFWQRYYSGAPDLLGQDLTINGRKYTVGAIMPQTFRGTYAWGRVPDAWVLFSSESPEDRAALADRNNANVELVGRLKDGVTMLQAQTNLQLVASRLERQYPDSSANLSKVEVLGLSGIGSFRGISGTGSIFGFLGVLTVITGSVLLIACANVASLLLARAEVRRREIAIRLALGAGRGRILRQLLTESGLLSIMGAICGVALAWALSALLPVFMETLPVQLELDVRPDWRVLGYMLAVAMFSAIAFGLKPAIEAARYQPNSALKNETRRNRDGVHFRRLLVASQVAVSFAMLMSAGLFVRSMQNVKSADPGFDTTKGLTMSFRLPPEVYSEAKGRTFFTELLERTRILPGVESASLAQVVPLSLENSRYRIWPENDLETSRGVRTYANIVAPDYFRTLSVPVLQGRDFGWQDRANSGPVAIVNETLARLMFPNEVALRRRIAVGGRNGTLVEIVGVVKDTKYISLGEDPAPILYRPFAQEYFGAMTLHVLAAGKPASVLTGLKQEIGKLDPWLAVSFKTMEDNLEMGRLPSRVGATLLGFLGLLGTGLASVGIFGIVAYSVSRRSREIGIRVALGARKSNVLRLAIGDGMIPVALGMTAGACIALALTRAIGGFLVGVSPADPKTFAGVLTLLGSLALLASYLPARKALKVDAAITLRQD